MKPMRRELEGSKRMQVEMPTVRPREMSEQERVAR